VIPEHKVKMRREEDVGVLSSIVLLGDKAKLGLTDKVLTVQEEATKDDDDVITYHLWDYWLTILWDRDVLPTPGVALLED
jgi:hypothetical protein